MNEDKNSSNIGASDNASADDADLYDLVGSQYDNDESAENVDINNDIDNHSDNDSDNDSDNVENVLNDEIIEQYGNAVETHVKTKSEVYDVHGKESKSSMTGNIVSIISILAIVALGYFAYCKYVGFNGFNQSSSAASKASSGISADDQMKDADIVLSSIEYMKNNNAGIDVKLGSSDKENIYLNKNGECIVKQITGNKAIIIYRNDKKSVQITNGITVGPDISDIDVMYNTVNLVKSSKATLARISNVDDTHHYVARDGYNFYSVTVYGSDNMKNVYNIAGNNEYSESKISDIETRVGASNGIGLQYQVIVGKNGYLSVTSVILANNNRYVNWSFDGYSVMSDWKLDDFMYNENIVYSKATSDKIDRFIGYVEKLKNR